MISKEDLGKIEGYFAAGTLVNMANGQAKPIEFLTQGDKVLSYVPSTETFAHGIVGTTHRTQATTCWLLNGSIRFTDSPLFYKNGQWMPISEFEIGDTFLNSKLEQVLVESIEKLNKAMEGYTIEVPGYETFFASNLLVHNGRRASFG